MTLDFPNMKCCGSVLGGDGDEVLNVALIPSEQHGGRATLHNSTIHPRYLQENTRNSLHTVAGCFPPVGVETWGAGEKKGEELSSKQNIYCLRSTKEETSLVLLMKFCFF